MYCSKKRSDPIKHLYIVDSYVKKTDTILNYFLDICYQILFCMDRQNI